MHPSVPNFNAAHDCHTLHNQILGDLSSFAGLKTVSAHERSNPHRHCPRFGNTSYAATHKSVYIDGGVSAFNVSIPEIDVEPAHESNQISAPKVLGADAVFSAAPDSEHVQLRRKITRGLLWFLIGTPDHDQSGGNHKHRPVSFKANPQIAQLIQFERYAHRHQHEAPRVPAGLNDVQHSYEKENQGPEIEPVMDNAHLVEEKKDSHPNQQPAAHQCGTDAII